MEKIYPDYQKGRNRLIFILILSGLPFLCIFVLVALDTTISHSQDYLIPMGLLGLFIGLIIFQLQGKKWARTLWAVICLLLAFLLFILSLGLLFTGSSSGFWVPVILFLLTAWYAVLGFSLGRNHHITAFFNSKEIDMLKKIDDLGKTFQR